MDFLNNQFVNTIINPKFPNGNHTVFVIKSELDTEILGEEINYLSKIIGLTIEYEEDGNILKGKFIIKAFSLAPLYHIGKSSGYYDREIKMYSKILPEMSKLLTPDSFYPLSFNSIYDQVLILENIKADGYSTVDRIKQLDLPHCKAALKMLAKFHAASVKLDKIIDMEDVKSDLWFQYKGEDNLITTIYEIGFEMFSKILETEMPQCLETFKNLKHTIMERLKILVNKNNNFNVLNHGDFHINHIMFKHDENDPSIIINTKMIDFQICRWCSPIVDIYYFFVISLPFETLIETHLNDLLQYYVDILNRELRKHGCEESYEFENVKNDFEDAWLLGLMVIFAVLPYTFPAQHQVVSKQTVEDETNPIEKFYQSDEYKKEALKWISYYHKKGLL